MSISSMPDTRLVLYYESIRTQVQLDKLSGSELTSGSTIWEYAAALRHEIDRRGLPIRPISWPDGK